MLDMILDGLIRILDTAAFSGIVSALCAILGIIIGGRIAFRRYKEEKQWDRKLAAYQEHLRHADAMIRARRQLNSSTQAFHQFSDAKKRLIPETPKEIRDFVDMIIESFRKSALEAFPSTLSDPKFLEYKQTRLYCSAEFQKEWSDFLGTFFKGGNPLSCDIKDLESLFENMEISARKDLFP